MADSRADNSQRSIRIISLNCWGIKWISKLHAPRFTEIGRRLATADPTPEIVGLQECFVEADFVTIRDAVYSILPYAKYYRSGIFGSGLAIFSKWPIEESTMVPYSLNGRPSEFYLGDWYVGKGVACARIRFGPARKDIMEVFCTHLHAPYKAEPKDIHLCHRTAQAWQIAKLMRHARERGHLTIALGDFNMRPMSLAYQIIEAHSGARDVWRILQPDSSLGSIHDPPEQARQQPVPDAAFNLSTNGSTCDSVLNTWRWRKAEQKTIARGRDVRVATSTSDPNGKRLDYVFVANGRDCDAGWAVVDANVGMTERHPVSLCSLSDHFSVEVTLATDPPSSKGSIGSGHPATGRQILPVSVSLPRSTYDDILDLSSSYRQVELRTGRLRLGHGVLQLIGTVGCLVAVWWSPRPFVSFLLMLFASVGLSAGVINALIGGLYVRSEMQALTEFDWEIALAKDLADRAVRSPLASEPPGHQPDVKYGT